MDLYSLHCNRIGLLPGFLQTSLAHTSYSDELSVHRKFTQERISIHIDLFYDNCKLRDFTTQVPVLRKFSHCLFPYQQKYCFRLATCENFHSLIILNEISESTSSGQSTLCLSQFQLGTSLPPPGKKPRENFFEPANPGYPRQFFCLIPLLQGKNDGQIPRGGAKFSQTRSNCSLSLQKNPLTLSYLVGGGGGAESIPLETFLNNSKTAQDIKMSLILGLCWSFYT